MKGFFGLYVQKVDFLLVTHVITHDSTVCTLINSMLIDFFDYQRYTNSSSFPFVLKVLFIVECTFCSSLVATKSFSEAIFKPNEAVELISLENQPRSPQPHFSLGDHKFY